MAIIDVVRFDGLKSRDWLIYKYPSEELVLGTQLIVQEGQVALFVRGGVVADVFYPGTYTLATENLPILKSLVNLPFGDRTPFSAEVYFINTTVRLDINWGTTDPIQLIDPKYYVKLRIRAFGQMGLKVLDVTTLFKEVIGGMQKTDIVKFDKVKEYYRGILVIKAKSAIADSIINNGISALEISTKLEALSEKVKEQVSPEFEKYGFSVANFFIQSINFPDEDFEKINKILEDKAAFEIMGDGRYATKRSFDVYEGAANNQSGVAGAFAAGGIGLGAAMGMGASMNQTVGNPIHKEDTKECVSCHAKIPVGSKFCPECGFNNSEKVCECGNKLAPGTKFCPECGKKV
ncbi:Membrane protease subunit, stomatin/prohibitin family, contains C-terminal Zn-ribbon domain [Pseudobutyrivibrio sp. C4]|uniref:SPFH domain-containing protein n=1 Tax=Pseudobutyrivibrio sp. C4 TaxID=1520803 RepID=UPI0008D6F05F|nr:SPFH domain-containing protein [Pseudobutyrivibrio sp. C4]SES66246.1 Membrane protease subunit, stomatin/prohibitin family, contains C-terminal Zn-ribbon domain [Pseudobutyrivibrio sp. C4]